MRKYVFLTCLLSFNALAIGQVTNLQSDVFIYSEYYPNSTTQFKGTIFFEMAAEQI